MSENRPTPPATVDSIGNAPTPINVPDTLDTADSMPTAQGKSKRKSKTSAKVQNQYKARNYDRVIIQVRAGDKQTLNDYATAHGLTVNALIIQAINAHCGDIIKPLAKNPYI